MKVEKNVNDVWIEESVIVDQEFQLATTDTELDIPQIWLDNGAYTPSEVGEYRVHAVIQDIEVDGVSTDFTYSDSFDFVVG